MDNLSVVHIKDQELAAQFSPIFTTESALQRYQQFKDFVRGVLKEGVDFGKIPGNEKDTLLKPGAEKLCTFFGLTPRYVQEVIIEDWSGQQHGQPLFYYRYKCQLFRGNFQMGEGIGSCSSWESKYRYRWVDEATVSRLGLDKKTLPIRGGMVSEFDFAINKAETSGQYGKPAEYWNQWKRAIEDGSARRIQKAKKDGSTSPAYEMNATFYRVPNADFADIINTVQKIAQKRSYVAATLSATNASDYFTQDIEDYIDVEVVPVEAKIDIGQNPMNSKEAQSYVLDRKLKELQQDPAPQPAATPIRHGPSPEVMELWGRMTSINAICEVFKELKFKLELQAGSDEGNRCYYAKLALYNAKHANEIAKRREDARKCVKELQEALRNYQIPTNPNIADEDIPR
jgi:hypothetical protein